MDNLIELTIFLVKNLVSNPDDFTVTGEEQEDNIILNVKVAESDIGTVIGRGGRTANSIRTLVQASAYLHGQGRVKINIDTK